MKTILKLTLLLTALLLTGWSPAQESRLAAGNTFVLRISGVPAEDIAQVGGNYTISSAGTVKLPYLDREIAASGLTATELQNKIAALYKSADIYTGPNVVVSTGTAGLEMIITVGGEVRNPADVPFRPGLNLFGAINRAGGPTEYGNMKKVKLIRGNSEKVYDLKKVTSSNNPELQAGDQVIVPSS